MKLLSDWKWGNVLSPSGELKHRSRNSIFSPSISPAMKLSALVSFESVCSHCLLKNRAEIGQKPLSCAPVISTSRFSIQIDYGGSTLIAPYVMVLPTFLFNSFISIMPLNSNNFKDSLSFKQTEKNNKMWGFQTLAYQEPRKASNFHI